MSDQEEEYSTAEIEAMEKEEEAFWEMNNLYQGYRKNMIEAQSKDQDPDQKPDDNPKRKFIPHSWAELRARILMLKLRYRYR